MSGDRRSDDFVWPPRGGMPARERDFPERDRAAHADGDRAAPGALPGELGPWPESPTAVSETSGGSTAADVDGGSVGGDGGALIDPGAGARDVGLSRWRYLERAVLGGSLPAMRSDWTPERAGSACLRCAGSVGAGEADLGGCAACRGQRLAWSRAVRVGSYGDEVKAGIVGCKYRRDREAGILLGRLLGLRVGECVAELGFSGDDCVVVPVPTTLRRRMANGGLDHSMVLARCVSAEIGGTLRCLLRRRHGPRLAGLSATERARRAKGAFLLKSGLRPAEAGVVVLVDDVRTTGATAVACFRALASGFGVGIRSDREAKGPVFVLATVGVSESRRAKTAILGDEGALVRKS